MPCFRRGPRTQALYRSSLKLLFDQNLSHKLAIALRREFPDSVHVRDVGLASVDDLAIWEHAKRFGFTIISKDGDFSQRSFLFGAPPKVIWVKLGNCSTRRIEEVLRLYSAEILLFESDRESAFLVIDPSLETALSQDLPVAKPKRIAIASNVIASIGYDPQLLILEVEFRHSGEIYQYFDVPASLYEELLNAPSKGSYLNSNIRQNHRFRRVL